MKVFILFRNADFTEGRGPMKLHSVWSDSSEAVKFMDAQTGIMGRPGPWSNESYGDWKLEPYDVFSSAEQVAVAEWDQKKSAALAKLTQQERRILGLD